MCVGVLRNYDAARREPIHSPDSVHLLRHYVSVERSSVDSAAVPYLNPDSVIARFGERVRKRHDIRLNACGPHR